MQTVKESNGNIIISGLTDFSAEKTFDCGQCFRFEKYGDIFGGVAFGKYLELSQPDDGTVIIHSCGISEYENVWKHFLALDEDYAAINSAIAAIPDSTGTIKKATGRGRGIRILRQDGWEALCSFIISQNNNIPRIKKLVSAISEKFGVPFEKNGVIRFSFPTPEALAEAGEAAIFELKTGFRAKYIYDAAKRVASGETDLDAIEKMSSADALEEIMKIKGVGPKVASCALLFGFSKTDMFPIDVWIRRVIERHFPDGLDISSLGEHAGIVQQYLFFNERYTDTI